MAVGDQEQDVDPDAATQVTEASSLTGFRLKSKDRPVANIPSGPSMGHGFGQPAQLPEDAGPPTVAQHMDFKDETIPRPDLPEPTTARPKLEPPPPPMPVSTAPQPPAPVPAPARKPKPAAAKEHDPAGDLTVIMMSNFACVAGAVFIVMAQEDWHRPMGLFVCLAGAILSLTVIISSDRGRKPSSMLMGYFLSFLLSGAAAFGLYSHEKVPSEPSIMVRNSTGDGPETPPEDLDAEQEGGEDDAPLEGEPDEVKEEAKADPPPAKPAETRASSSTRFGTGAFPATGSASRTPDPTPAPKEEEWEDDWERPSPPPPPPEPEPEPEPVRAASGSEGVPLQVLDTMLRTNRKVKGCFVSYRNQTGVMPSGRINVRLRVVPSGRPTEVGISGGPYAGTTLDSCLDGAISSIQFPPFDGDSKTYTYPFLL
jgi:hypothetical protein